MTNHQTIVGNLTSDPGLKFSRSGTAWVTFTIADNRKDGDEDKSTFIRCKAFKTLAENIAESLTKGTRVIAFGRLEQENWESNGEKRSALVLLVDAIGPDLRFATARATRNERNATTPPPPGDDPWADGPGADEPPF